jgi:hypothetical protein
MSKSITKQVMVNSRWEFIAKTSEYLTSMGQSSECAAGLREFGTAADGSSEVAQAAREPE